jgi:uncharacterized protein YcaQ
MTSPAPRAARRRTLSAARRTALAAQGLAGPRPAGPVTAARYRATVERLGLLQIDSVNVLARAHLVPVFSRLGPYDTGLLDRAASRAPRRLVEYWAHEASFVPPATYRLLEWRRRRYRDQAWGSISATEATHSAEVQAVREIVAEHGPLTATEVEVHLGSASERPADGWGWRWSVTKRALELLFFTGEITSAGRTASFERRYDVVERVLPADVLAAPAPTDAECVRGLVEIGARAHGVGTLGCFADYFRLRGPAPRAALAELVDEGVLEPVTVTGWDRPTYRHRDARTPRRAAARTLLSPFDPLVFERRRLAELFGTHYRIEIYVPAARRVHGYYVLPFLEGEAVTARVDLKADRRAGVLRVLSAHRDPAVTPETADALAHELGVMAGWLGLDDVEVERSGDLAQELATSLRVQASTGTGPGGPGPAHGGGEQE